MRSGQHPQSRCSSQEIVQQSRFEVGGKVDRRDCCMTSSSVTWLGQDPTFDLATSPLGLLLLHDLLALLSPPFVDGVAWVVDLESVLVLHVGILDFSGLLIKLQNMAHPSFVVVLRQLLYVLLRTFSDGRRQLGLEAVEEGQRLLFSGRTFLFFFVSSSLRTSFVPPDTLPRPRWSAFYPPL